MNGNEPTDHHVVEKLLAEYGHAQEVGHQTDTIIHEVIAIVWGANTLLLGFVLEVPCSPGNQDLVIAVAIVGLLMSVYVPWVHHHTKKVQRTAYEICRKIEVELPLAHSLNTRIQVNYPRWKPGLVAVWVLTVVFLSVWSYVIWHAGKCLLNAT